jgi:hypothetical protein
MKKAIFFFLSAWLLLFNSCSKDELKNLINLDKLPEFGSIVLESNAVDSFSVRAILETDGFDTPLASGFCISSTNVLPNLEDSIITAPLNALSLTQVFAWNFSKKLYIRAFCENSVGISYSDPLEVQWSGGPENLPIVTTDSILEVSYNSIQVRGNIISTGGLPIVEKGFCYSAFITNPTEADAKQISDGADFTVMVNGLTDSTLYYVRPFARNIQGIAYGDAFEVTTRNVFEIGETGPAGGLIFYRNKDAEGIWRYLEVAPFDLAGLLKWAPNGENIAGTSTSIASGQQNTESIVAILGAVNSYAALPAQNYSLGGYSDWYLPSRDELVQMREGLFTLNLGAFTTGAAYWSSSQDQTFPANAWIVNMSPNQSGSVLSIIKTQNCRIRPIRNF